MSTFDKLIKKVFYGSNISYKDAEKILLRLGFDLEISGSHHIFRKAGFPRSIALTRRSELQHYQIGLLKEALIRHGYKKI